MVAVPYTLDVNDSVIDAVEKHSSDEQYRRRLGTLEGVEPELERSPRVIWLSFHHHLSGVLHRIRCVEKMLDTLLARHDTVFMTGGQIADWFTEADRAKGGGPAQGTLAR
jgi:allantoinase